MLNDDKTREKLKKRKGQVTDAICKALRDKGHKIEKTPSLIDGFRTGFSIEYECGSSYSYGYTGKLRMKMGTYSVGNKNYPEPNAGFDIEKAVERLLDVRDRVEQKDKAETTRKENDNAADETLKQALRALGENNPQPWTHNSGHGYIKKYSPERVIVSFKIEPEKVWAAIEAIKKLGGVS